MATGGGEDGIGGGGGGYTSMDAVIDNPDRLSEYYRDEAWLAAYPLTIDTVLDYFAFSPFYSRDCINERVKLQMVDATQSIHMVGVEYIVRIPDAATPGLFVIDRVQRRSPRDVAVLSVYYCLHGTVYQAPDLATLLSSRVEKAAHLLTRAIRGVEELRAAALKEEAARAGASGAAAGSLGGGAARGEGGRAAAAARFDDALADLLRAAPALVGPR